MFYASILTSKFLQLYSFTVKFYDKQIYIDNIDKWQFVQKKSIFQPLCKEGQ